MRGRICDRKGSRGARLALGLLPQVADGIDSGVGGGGSHGERWCLERKLWRRIKGIA